MTAMSTPARFISRILRSISNIGGVSVMKGDPSRETPVCPPISFPML
jgi:hypothetical protein